MTESRITIKDLAKRLNYSVSTISRALNHHHSISEKTTREILDLAAKLGYSHNNVASSLRTQKSNMIGVIAPRIDIYFHSRVISGIEEVAYKNGYNVTIYQSMDSFEREVEITKIIRTNMVAGVIACLAIETINFDHFQEFDNFKIPLVLYDRVGAGLSASKVIIDDFNAAFIATEHLIKSGCRRIAHIAGSQTTGIFQSRFEGYRSALMKNGLQCDNALVCPTEELSISEGKKCARKLLKLSEKPDGIFCANDYTAIGAIQEIKKSNLSVPEDIAVVGFSNYPVATIIEPSLTTIDDRAFDMGKAATRLLIRQIEDKNSYIDSETIVIKTDLVIRESSKRGKGK
jgi:LacI family transcriptional regulator